MVNCLPFAMTVSTLNIRAPSSTSLRISEISFGAGPVAAHMTKNEPERRRKAVQHALEAGINWFDTAATCGEGQSETNLGAVLREPGALDKVHIATKARLTEQSPGNLGEAIWSSVTTGLKRPDLPCVTLIQLHNSVTKDRGDQPTSITPRDMLGKDGVLDAFEKLKAVRLVKVLPPGIGLKEASIHYVLGNAQISTALAGFANAEQIDDAVQFAQAGPLTSLLLERLLA
jgi:aryl-alcohol dehydrogenase-like predicted oxidoreductase